MCTSHLGPSVDTRCDGLTKLVVTEFTLIFLLGLFLTLKMEAICSSEMSIDVYQTTWHYIAEDKTLQLSIFVCTRSFCKSITFNVNAFGEKKSLQPGERVHEFFS
jgi:hypothetical protein